MIDMNYIETGSDGSLFPSFDGGLTYGGIGGNISYGPSGVSADIGGSYGSPGSCPNCSGGSAYGGLVGGQNLPMLILLVAVAVLLLRK